MIGRADKANSGSPFLFMGLPFMTFANLTPVQSSHLGLVYRIKSTQPTLILHLSLPLFADVRSGRPISESPFLPLQAFFSLCQAEGFLGAEKKFILASPAHSAELKMSQGRGRLLYDICIIFWTLRIRSPLALAASRMPATQGSSISNLPYFYAGVI